IELSKSVIAPGDHRAVTLECQTVAAPGRDGRDVAQSGWDSAFSILVRAAMLPFSLRLLGTFQELRDGAPVTRFRGDKVRALLAYLASEAERPHARYARGPALARAGRRSGAAQPDPSAHPAACGARRRGRPAREHPRGAALACCRLGRCARV